jgi:hypothetical protein
MARYLRVESEPVVIHCYQCGAGFAFATYDRIIEATCAECSTPLFLPHELEGISTPNKGAQLIRKKAISTYSNDIYPASSGTDITV